MLLPGNLDVLSQTLRGPVVPLVCGFIRRDNLQAWRQLIRNLAYDFRRNTSTLSEFIGYGDSTDFSEISLGHSRDNNEPKGVHLRNTSRTFLATSTINMDI